jgi:glycosyltransferase involved in cell wall biosynthesis
MSIDIAGDAVTALPLVSFVLVSYNQEEFIAEAVAGAFAQTYTPLQIILSDDCSSDATFAIMEEAVRQYRGPHSVVINRNECNLGIGRHINKVVELAEGEWLVGAAGDDISLPERTAKIMTAARQSGGQAKSIWSRAQHMRADGTLLDIFEQSTGAPYSPSEIVENQRVVMGCSHAWHRDVFQVFGPLYHKVMFEDNAISFRSFLLGKVVYVDDTLVHYRQHASNLTNYSREMDQAILERRMATRRHYAVVGIYQRLLDVMTFRHLPGIDVQRIDTVNRLLLRQLVKQIIKMNLGRRMPGIDRFTSRVRKTIRKFK